MSLDDVTICPFQWTNRLEGTPMEVFLRAAVDREVVVGWHRPGPKASSIVIMIGGEQLSLEFFDEESLRRLRDVADHAIPQLRAAIADNARRNEEFLRTWTAEHPAEAGAV
jgi:hypothetical protein